MTDPAVNVFAVPALRDKAEITHLFHEFSNQSYHYQEGLSTNNDIARKVTRAYNGRATPESWRVSGFICNGGKYSGCVQIGEKSYLIFSRKGKMYAKERHKKPVRLGSVEDALDRLLKFGAMPDGSQLKFEKVVSQ